MVLCCRPPLGDLEMRTLSNILIIFYYFKICLQLYVMVISLQYKVYKYA